MFIPFVFIGPIFKLLPLWEALQGAGIQNKTLIKVHKTLLVCSCRVTGRIHGASKAAAAHRPLSGAGDP